MNTAEALEKITDNGQFEILALRTLRELETECRAIIHLGMNAQGKTIPGPLDGFHLLPGSQPARYVAAAFTTTARASLHSKWLNESNPKPRKRSSRNIEQGDLIKMGEKAQAIRAKDADARFLIYLCTNARLDDDLMNAVYAQAAKLQLDVEFLEQSRLRDFLDTTPLGQWLRQEHLGIEADLLARDLLQTLCAKNLNHYAAEVLLTDADTIIKTQAAESATEVLNELATTFLFLAGPSGAGKSVAALQILQHHLAGGGVALWIPAHVAEHASSTPEAVGAVLRSLHPRLSQTAGHDALGLARAEDPLLLVIDDLNRSANPEQLITKILGWSAVASRFEGEAAPAGSAVRLLCPIWHAYLESHGRSVPSWVRTLRVGPMLREESISCLRASISKTQYQFSPGELDTLAERLRDDPILLGLFGRMLQTGEAGSAPMVFHDVIESFVDASFQKLAARNRTAAPEYASALLALAGEMIRTKVLSPTWQDIEQWFGENGRRIGALSQLADGVLCRIVKRDRESYFEFRHDRIGGHFLVRATADLLAADGDRDSLFDPFFVPFIASALALRAIPEDSVRWVKRALPAALVGAVPLLRDEQSVSAKEILMQAREWLETAEGALPSVQTDALSLLAADRSSLILPLTSGLPDAPLMLAARLRNGDVVAGAKLLAGIFHPSKRDEQLEAILGAAIVHNGAQMAKDLNEMFQSGAFDQVPIDGALSLAGYIGSTSLVSGLLKVWNTLGRDEALLLPTAWAALRCSSCESFELLRLVLVALVGLPDDETFSQKDHVLQELRFGLRHGIDEAVLEYLTDLGQNHEQYRWLIVNLLQGTDHPRAVRFVAYQFGADRARRNGAFFPWASQWRTQWGRDHDNMQGSGLSAASMVELRTLWEAPDTSEGVREFAFSVWALYAKDLDVLRSVPENSALFSTAAWHRALLADPEIVPYVKERVRADSRWFTTVPHIWSPALREELDAAMATLASTTPADPWDNVHHDIAGILREIPPEISWGLLSKHWSGLGNRPLFIQAALYAATPESRAAAATSVQNLDVSQETFRHVGPYFGFMDSNRSNRITSEHLGSLQPYVSRLPEVDFSSVVQFCRVYGHWEWALRHLRQECLSRASVARNAATSNALFVVRTALRWFPTDEDLINELDEIEKAEDIDHRIRLLIWLSAFSQRGESYDRSFAIIERWLKSSTTSRRCRIAVHCLSMRGTRKALLTFARHISSEPGELLKNVDYQIKRRTLL